VDCRPGLEWPVFFAVVALCLCLSACGGNGGGRGGQTPMAFNVLKVTVSDTFGSKVAGAMVRGPQGKWSTDSQGVALLLIDPKDSSASVTVSRDSFVDKSMIANIVAGKM